MSKILITGASGFIGSNLTRRLVDSKNDISIIIRKQSKLWRLRDILSKIDIQIADLSNADTIRNVVKKTKPDIVYHCASYGVKASERDLYSMIKHNISSTANLLLALEKYGQITRFVNLGSESEYGIKSNSVKKETDVAKPIGLHGITKNFQTQLVQYFAYSSRLPTVTLRIFNAYGKYEEPRRLIPDIMTALVKKNKLTVFSRSTKRDFIFIEDVINAIIKAGEKKDVEGEIFNVGTGIVNTVENVVKTACEVAKIKLEILWYDKKCDFEEMDRGGYANIKKSKKLDWQPECTLREGLLKTYKWFSKNIHAYP